MFGSTILDVATALVFTFLAVSLASGAAVEAISSIAGMRARTLKTGIKDLLNDQQFRDLAAELYGHALINPRAPGLPPAENRPGIDVSQSIKEILAKGDEDAKRALTLNLGKNLPSYIDPKQFASALMDVLSLWPAPGNMPTAEDLQKAVDTRVPQSTYPQINQLLTGIIRRTNGDLTKINSELAGWFDNAMSRLSGLYKRYTQVIAFLCAFVICGIVNADSLLVAQRVWAQPTLAETLQIEGNAANTFTDNQKIAEALPFGWPLRDADGKSVNLWSKALGPALLGWLITALASLFGAPFWFDALQRITRLKGAGPSPEEKAEKTAAAA